MKYLIKLIWHCVMIICFIIGFIAQFLWNFKRPTVALKPTIDKSKEFVENALSYYNLDSNDHSTW